MRPEKSKLLLWHSAYTIWVGPRCVELSRAVKCQAICQTELADTRKLIWSGNTAAPQELTNDSGSTATALATAHTKIMSMRMERLHTHAHIQ